MQRFLHGFFLALGLLCAKTLFAQGSPQDLFTAAEDKLQAGDSKGAAELYQKLVSEFPTFEGLISVKYNLALALLYSEDYEKAIAQFKELSSSATKDAALREQAALGLGGAQTVMARTQSDPKTKLSLLDESIQSYDGFLKNYPQSASLGEAFFGKASSQFFAEHYDDAEKTLASFASVKASASLRNDANYLMGRALAAEAVQFKEQKRDADMRAKLDAALKVLDQVAQNTVNAVIANDALFTAGETLFQTGSYPEAIRYLKRIQSKKYLEEQQKLLVDALRKERAQAMMGSNQDAQADMNRQYMRSAARLREIQGKPALFLNARLVIAQCLYEQKKYDEVVVLLKHDIRFCEEDQKKRAFYFMIKAMLQNNQTNRAIATFQEYKAQHSGEKLSEDVLLALADDFNRRKRWPEALEWIQEYQTMFPDGKHADAAALLQINIYTAMGDLEKSKKAGEAFRLRFPNSALASSAVYNDAYLHFQKKEYDAAIADFQKLTQEFPDSDNAETARFFIGKCFYELKKPDEATQALLDFEKAYPKSKLIPNSIFHRAKACEEKKDLKKADELYAQIIKDYPDDELAPFAMFGIARNHWGEGGHTDEALALFDQFIAKYPTHSLAPSAYLFKATIYRSLKRLDDAMEVYRVVAEKYPDDPNSAEALILSAELNSQNADRMATRPEKLPPRPV